MTADDGVLAWHFLPDDGKLRYRPYTTVKVGETLSLPGGQKPQMCKRGFHASERLIDALVYAPGSLVCRVRVEGDIDTQPDKLVGRSRTVLWMADATTALHEFGAWAAEWILDRLEAKGYKIDPRSRAAIEAKRAWLRHEITDAQLAAADGAAWAAAWAAAWDAHWAAARDAHWAAARDAAWAAAWAAAGEAARDAHWAAARAAAGAAAGDCWAAARAAAWDAHCAAHWAELNAELTRRIEELSHAA